MANTNTSKQHNRPPFEPSSSTKHGHARRSCPANRLQTRAQHQQHYWLQHPSFSYSTQKGLEDSRSTLYFIGLDIWDTQGILDGVLGIPPQSVISSHHLLLFILRVYYIPPFYFSGSMSGARVAARFDKRWKATGTGQTGTERSLKRGYFGSTDEAFTTCPRLSLDHDIPDQPGSLRRFWRLSCSGRRLPRRFYMVNRFCESSGWRNPERCHVVPDY